MRLRRRPSGEGGRACFDDLAASPLKRARPSCDELGAVTTRTMSMSRRTMPAYGRPLVYEATIPCTSAVVWLHGFADNPESWAAELAAARAARPACKWILLRAARRPITCYRTSRGREAWCPAWGDFVDKGPVKVGSKDHDAADAAGWYEDTAAVVHAVVDSLVAEDGVPPERVAIVGQSQGGASAAHAALSYSKRLAGLAVLQGWLLPAARAALASPSAPHLAGLPVLVSHGDADAEVGFDCAQQARRLLGRAGCAVEAQTLRGAGHFLGPPDAEALQQRALRFLDSLGGRRSVGVG